MKRNRVGRSKVLMAAVSVIIIAVACVGIYSIFTFPQSIVSLPVSFAIGADVKRQEFSVPVLHEWVQVEVVVASGNLLWTAEILNNGTVLWTHRTIQTGQTLYRSEWVKLASGNYNFTFATAGIGSLEAQISVTSKGGFW